MTSKAIVFYTGDLQEIQENSLREIHGIEHIIFAPIETAKDLETKLLENTEKPFTVYNYLTDPNLVIALCDKLLNFTNETGYTPEYFIWVETTKNNQREETIKMSTNKPRITRVMNPESFMVSGIALSDDVMFGFAFDAEPNCFIYTSSEKNLLSWFNAFIMNLANSKREFPMLKAVIYAFDDERNQPMLGDDRDHQFITRHIVAALELFGETEGVKIFKPTEVEEFKQAISLTEEELEQRKEMVKQAKQNDAMHVDVSNMEMPSSVKQVMEHLQKQSGKRPNPYLSYGEAIEMCKTGIDVACVNWSADTFLTVNTGAYVHADNFWSPGNKRMALSRPDKSMSVFPHFLRTNYWGTVPHMVDFNDQFSEWVVASDRIKVKSVDVNTDEGLPKLTLRYALDTFSTPDFELAPFWIVYDVLAKLPHRVTVIGDNPKSELPHIVGSMKEAHDNRQQIVEESYQFDEDGIDDNMYPHRGVDFVCSIGLNDILKRIEAGEFKDVILDDDSFKTDFRLEKIKKALQRTNANWVTVSVKEQLFGISE